MESTMLKKILLTIGTAAAALAASGSALAEQGHWRDRDGERYEHRWHGPYRHYYYAPRPVYVVPAPRVVYAPLPPVVYPYYAAPGFSVRFSFPL
jgi:hypothetical protein